MADPIVNVNLPGEPARKVTTQDPTVAVKKRTKAGADAAAALETAHTAQQNAQRAKADVDLNTAMVDEMGANLAEGQETAHFNQRQQSHALQSQEIAKLKTTAAEKRAAMEASERNIDKALPAWKSVLAGVLAGFSQYAHTRAGGSGQAPGVEALNAAFQRDRQQKVDAFMRSKEFAARAQNDVQTAESSLRQRLADIDNEHVAAGNLLARRIANMKARFKSAEAKASADATLAQLQATQAEKTARMESEFGAQVTRHGQSVTTTEQAPTSATGLKPSQAETAADLNGLASDIGKALANPVATEAREKFQNNKAIAGRAAEMKGPVGALFEVGGRKAGVVPKSYYEGLTPQEKAGVRAREQLRAKQQKIITGLAAPVQEQQDIMSRYGIDPTDSPETEREKLTMFAQEITNRAVQAGPLQQQYLRLAEDIKAQISGKAPTASGGAPAANWSIGDRVVKSGKTYEMTAEGWMVDDGAP